MQETISERTVEQVMEEISDLEARIKELGDPSANPKTEEVGAMLQEESAAAQKSELEKRLKQLQAELEELQASK